MVNIFSVIFLNRNSFQLDFGDSLSFFDGRYLQSQQINKLNIHFNNEKMTISSTGKDMLVQFITNHEYVNSGFQAYFHYIRIEPNCTNWLNMTAKLLKSPEFPTIDCHWVITASSIDSTIVIDFDFFEVNWI